MNSKGVSCTCTKLSCFQNPRRNIFLRPRNTSGAKEDQFILVSEDYYFEVSSVTYQYLQNWYQKRKSKKLFYIFLSLIFLANMIDRNCLCKGTIYILIAIPYISLFQSRVLRAQDCTFFPNRNQIQAQIQYFINQQALRIQV